MGKRGALPKGLHLPSGMAPVPPEKPIDLPQDVSAAWDWIVAECTSRRTLTTGDAMVVEAASRLWARYIQLEQMVNDDPAEEKFHRLSLATLRQWGVVAGKLGLNPMDLARLVSCRNTEETTSDDDLLD